MNKELRMKELVTKLNSARRAYYQKAEEIMSNLEYDALYDELEALEKELGVTLSNSPTIEVGYEIVSELPKERHESPMLSLDKTKEVEALADFLGDEKALLSWKMDGLTIVLTYNEGKLIKAVTRGNGEVGEVVTNNARTFKNIPLTIPYKDELILRGEAIITYSDFEKINDEIEDAEAKYKNPRNLCSGSVRQLNSEITARRNVQFFAFAMVKAEGVDFSNSHKNEFEWLTTQGFDVVEYHMVDKNSIEDEVKYFANKIPENDFPSDGLVLLYDDISYGKSLGRTAKFPRDAIAFKWADERKRTKLLEIEWSPSRTGLINPVAIFEPVELEGTTVARASVHNISIVEELELGIGDEIEVYKANMIIPQIAENLTRSNTLEIPKTCPVCNHEAIIKQVSEAKALYCTNPDCPIKHLKSYALMVSRDALGVDGMSEATLEKLIDNNIVAEFTDLFHLQKHREEIENLEGFGKLSYTNMISAIEKARETSLEKVIYGLGIAGIGLANAKIICKHFDYDEEAITLANEEELSVIDGVGPIMAASVVMYFKDEQNLKRYKDLLSELHLQKPEKSENSSKFEGVNFVITGSVEHFANRNEVKELIEGMGGKVTGSVTSKTNYLINNDVTSNSSKNKKAKELGVPIISEEDFLKLLS